MSAINTAKDYMLFRYTKGMTEKIYYELLNHYNSLDDIYNADYNELSLAVGRTLASNIKNKLSKCDFVNREFELAEKNNVRIVGYNDKDYPYLLKEIYTPPYYFYLKGSLECLSAPTISIIGSRKSSKSGLLFAEKISYDLASAGYTVISGFARGIDISAHLGAVKKGATVAVIGSGMNNIYPASHKRYISDVLEKGAIITEYPFDEKPMPYNFPKRNRIISGLSLGVLVVEAVFGSGSLITVDYALDQNRELFAVPHFPTNTNSAVIELIKNGAFPVETYEDIIENLGNTSIYRRRKNNNINHEVEQIEKDEKVTIQQEVIEYKKKIQSDLKNKKVENNINFATSIHQLVYNAISKEPLSYDELCCLLNISVDKLLRILTELELQNLITKTDTGDYIIDNRINNG